MGTVAIEGAGATIEFASSGIAADILNITLPEKQRAEIETTHLGSTWKTFKASKIFEAGTFTVEFDHDPDETWLIDQDEETITINYPLVGDETTPASLTFTGFCTSEGGEEFTIGERATTKVTIRITGEPTYAQGS